jgi:hypothetical protein
MQFVPSIIGATMCRWISDIGKGGWRMSGPPAEHPYMPRVPELNVPFR